MKKKIESISFFYQGERIILTSGIRGTFRIPVTTVRGSKVKRDYKKLTAREVVEHKIIKNCDPFFTLTTGEKIRVYQGGDSSYLPAMSEGIIEKHDITEVEHRRRSTRSLAWHAYSSSAEDYLEFPWGDVYGN